MRKLIYFCFLICILYFLSFIFYLSSKAQTELSVSMQVGDTTITFSGKASPNSQITIIENSAVIGTTTSDTDGNFSKKLVAQDPGMHEYGLYLSDGQGVNSSTVTYSISLPEFTESEVSNFIFPSTISLSDSSLSVGDTIAVYGQAVPSSQITLFFSGNISTSLSCPENGRWITNYDISQWSEGSYAVYGIVKTSGGYESESSETKTFTINLQPTATPTPTATSTPTATPTITPTLTITPSITPGGPTNTPGPGPTATPGPGPTATVAPSATPALVSIKKLPKFLRVFDTNGDNVIDLSDLYFAVKTWVVAWRAMFASSTCDLNNDGKCDLVDFSILMYHINR